MTLLFDARGARITLSFAHSVHNSGVSVKVFQLSSYAQFLLRPVLASFPFCIFVEFLLAFCLFVDDPQEMRRGFMFILFAFLCCSTAKLNFFLERGRREGHRYVVSVVKRSRTAQKVAITCPLGAAEVSRTPVMSTVKQHRSVVDLSRWP